ncbi:Acetyltransferase (GNAT) domain-containing protein [Frankineae bacterium MT45]|nr:Acetyltransferase (GNAT) domain-containing protein [Frankineae bacterium MT45]
MEPSAEFSVRESTPADVDAIVETITTAFFNDPTWGPVFTDVDQRATQAGAFWRLVVTSAQRYPWMLVTGGVESAALWIPPGGTELDDAEAAGFESFLVTTAGASIAQGILDILERFEAVHPTEPHFYLSLFATHDRYRGAGFGMRLLRENLARIDALGAAAYLESSNPANDERYRSVGFTEHAKITIPSGHVVTGMWRPARMPLS